MVLAMMTTLLTVVLILIGTSLDYLKCIEHVYHPHPNFDGIMASFGTFFFGFGGHPVFPSVQHDMKDPTKFTYSALVAFSS